MKARTRQSYDDRKTVFRQVGDRCFPFYRPLSKSVHQKETNIPAAEPQKVPSVPRGIVSELEKVQSKYGNLSEPVFDSISEECSAFLSSASAKSERKRLLEQSHRFSQLCSSTIE